MDKDRGNAIIDTAIALLGNNAGKATSEVLMVGPGYRSWTEEKRESFIRKTRTVVEELKCRPYTSGSYISRKLSLSASELSVIYKTIQCSDKLQDELRQSYNGDYIEVVRRQFDQRSFEVVFFVGMNCPLRCVFCPSVEVLSNGKRRLKRYISTSGQRISRDEIRRVFEDLMEMRRSGIKVSVKVSGGLEPFSDAETVAWVLSESRRHGIFCQILTNGVLLNAPDTRALALTAGSVRVSVSVHGDAAFKNVCLGQVRQTRVTFDHLVDGIRRLVADRDRFASGTVIGMNSVFGGFNVAHLEKIVELAAEVGVDYIDLKPDYFATDKKWLNEADLAIKKIQGSLTRGHRGRTKVRIAGSMDKRNVFNLHVTGSASVQEQCRHKLFITPFGECSPVHHGAFPQSESARNSTGHRYCLGRVSRSQGIIELLRKKDILPEIGYHNLNPYERILALESLRREEDKRFGLDAECSPYDISKRARQVSLSNPQR